MSFIYNCGRLVPVKVDIADNSWKSILFCVSTGVVLLVIVNSAFRESRCDKLNLALLSLQSDIEVLKKRIERLENLVTSSVSTSTDTSDLTGLNKPEKDTQTIETKKLPLTLDSTPHYKATTDISGKLIRRHNYVSD